MRIVLNRLTRASIVCSIVSINLAAQSLGTAQQALEKTFDNFRSNSCGLAQWYMVKKDKFLDKTENGNDKNRPTLERVPPVFNSALSDYLSANIVVSAGTTLDTVLEKVYTATEVANQSEASYNSSSFILGSPSLVTPSADQAAAYKPLALYSRSCNYFLSYAMNAGTDYTLPFASLKAAFSATSGGKNSASIVLVGGQFPSRFAALWEGNGPGKIYAASSLWQWYQNHGGEVSGQKLYYRRFARGFTAYSLVVSEDRLDATVSASGNLSAFFGHIDGKIDATISSAGQSKASDPRVNLIKVSENEKEFVDLPDVNAAVNVLKNASAVRSGDASGQAKFDNANKYHVNQQIEGLPDTVCSRSWSFTPAASAKVTVSGLVTSKAIPQSPSSLPACSFTFDIGPSVDIDANAASIKLNGLLKTTDKNDLQVQVGEVEVYLTHRASPSHILGAPISQVDPLNWKALGNGKYDLQYLVTVPFDDQDNSLGWSTGTNFNIDSGMLSCDDKSKYSLLTVPGSVSTDPKGKSVAFKLSYTVYPDVTPLDIYSAEGRRGHKCSVSFSLKAPRAGGGTTPFTIDSEKVGGFAGLYFPSDLPHPKVTLVASGGTQPSALPDGTLPDGTTNNDYNGAAKFLAADGNPPYQWKLVGNPPPGLTITAKGPLGILSGSPQVAGDYSFTVQASDSSGDPQSGQKVVQITIKDPLAVMQPSPKDGVVGTPYSFALSAAGGVPKYKWEISGGTVPDGLKLSPDDGKISGTPTKSGQFFFGVKVSDSATPSKSATAAVEITIGQ